LVKVLLPPGARRKLKPDADDAYSADGSIDGSISSSQDPMPLRLPVSLLRAEAARQRADVDEDSISSGQDVLPVWLPRSLLRAEARQQYAAADAAYRVLGGGSDVMQVTLPRDVIAEAARQLPDEDDEHPDLGGADEGVAVLRLPRKDARVITVARGVRADANDETPGGSSEPAASQILAALSDVDVTQRRCGCHAD